MANASTTDGRLGRLTSMDRHELFDRFRQNLTTRARAAVWKAVTTLRRAAAPLGPACLKMAMVVSSCNQEIAAGRVHTDCCHMDAIRCASSSVGMA